MQDYLKQKTTILQRLFSGVSISALILSSCFFTFGTRVGETYAAPSSAAVSSFPITDGDVNAIQTAGDGSVYIGGNFTYVGPYTGYGAVVNKTTASVPSGNAVPNGVVRAVGLDGSGGYYIGGDFTLVGTTTRNHIAHILSDGTLDPTFDGNANSYIEELVVANGVLYVGGNFSTIGGQTRNNLAALNLTTGVATSWNPNLDNRVLSIVFDGANTLYVGGFFTTVGVTSRNRIAAIDTTTGLATAFDPNANSNLDSLALSGTTLYASGNFTTIGGQSRNRIAALDTTTGLATAWNPGSNGTVYEIRLSGTTLYAGGLFTSIGGSARNNIAALDTTTNTLNATAWDPNANGVVFGLELSGSMVYVAGGFTTIGGQSRQLAAAIDTATGLATSFDPNTGIGGGAIVVAVDATNVYFGGNFTSIGGKNRKGLAKIGSDGTISSWNPAGSTSMTVNALLLSGSTLYTGGTFTGTIGGQSRTNLVALDTTTGSATTLNIAPNAVVKAFALNGTNLYIGGQFTLLGASSRAHLGAIDTGTESVTAWDPGVVGFVYALVADGTDVYIGGSFGTAAGSTRNNIAAISPATGLATAWDPNANGQVNALLENGGVIYAGGAFTTIGGGARKGIASLSIATGTANVWDAASPSATINTITPDGTTTLYVGGTFATIGGGARTNLAALSTSTALVTTWDPNITGTVFSSSLQGSVVYIGGSYTAVGGSSRPNLSQFGVTTPTLSTLSPGFENVGAAALTLSVTGLDFISSSVLRWNGSDRTTTFGSSTSLSATIPSTDFTSAATVPVTIFNPSPGGGLSSLINFSVVVPSEKTYTSQNYAPAATFFSQLIVSGNLNGDAFPDIVTNMSATTHGFGVSLNNGDGTFPATGTAYSTGGHLNPIAIKLADIDIDGDQDVALVFSSSIVDLFFNDGTGVFTGPTTVSVPAVTRDVEIVDIDGDTDMDIITVHQTANQVGVTIQTGINTGSYGATTTYSTGAGTNPRSVIAFKHINPSGVVDRIATANIGDNTVSVFTNTAGVLSATHANVSLPSVNTLTTLNAGSIRHIGVVGSNNLYYLANGGSGTFSLSATFPFLAPTSANRIYLGNVLVGGSSRIFSTDGINTVVESNYQGDNQTIYRPDPTNPSTLSVSAITAADFDNDGVMDFATSNSNNTQFSVMLQTVVSSISPTNVYAGSAGLTLTVNGRHFDSGSVVYVDGVAKTTTYVSPTQLTAAITSGDITSAGSLSVRVKNPSVSQAAQTDSGATFFTVDPLPVPTLSTIVPDTKTEGDPSFVLSANGSDFFPTSVIRVNGSDRATTFVNSGQITATVLNTDISTAGTVNITVFNPTPGGGLSAIKTLTVTSAVPVNPGSTGGGNTIPPVSPNPVITELTPNSRAKNRGEFTLRIKGSKFNSTAKVQFNVKDIPTTFVSETELTAQVPEELLVNQGTVPVTVSIGDGVTSPYLFSDSTQFLIGPPETLSLTIEPVLTVDTVSSLSDIVLSAASRADGISFDNVSWEDNKSGAFAIQGFADNAQGYTVTVKQDGDLRNDNGEVIPPFDGNTGSPISNGAPVPWVEPKGTGFMGYSTTSTSVSGGIPNRFFLGGVRKWAAFTTQDAPIATHIPSVSGKPTSFTDYLLVRVGLGKGQPAGKYKNNIIITIVPNVQ
ncbi:MAG: FG-GAP-like repeat-containing protein [Patescibacteria group bacterium]